MKTDVETFLRSFHYSSADTDELLAALDCILAVPEAKQRLAAMRKAYIQNRSYDGPAARQEAQAISALAGIHENQGFFLFLILLAKPLREFYREKNISEAIWYNSMLDLKWKNEECKFMYGMCGTFTNWFARFFDMTRFAIGRLQFEINMTDRDFAGEGLILPAGSPVINIHIPRGDTKLDHEAAKEAYRDAAAFFAPGWPKDKPMVFYCRSWLLFPRHREILKPTSNIIAFMDDFIPLEDGLCYSYDEVWRIFNKKYTGNADELPQDNSMRRGYASWIRNGEKTGWGIGAFVYREKE